MVETVTCCRVPGPLAFQRGTLKSLEWPGDEAMLALDTCKKLSYLTLESVAYKVELNSKIEVT